MKLHQWIGASLLAVVATSSMAFADDLAPLEGVWAEDICKSSKIESARKQEFWSFETSIAQAVNSMVYFDQTDRRCENPPKFYINTYFEYRADPLKEGGEFSKIDFVIEKIAFKSDDDAFVKRLASEEACGLKNWVVGREIDISARDCSEHLNQKFREPLDKLYAVYKLDKDLNLVLTKKLKNSSSKRQKGKKQTFVKIQDR